MSAVPQTLPIAQPRLCTSCEGSLPKTKVGAGKQRLYCSDACKAAAWRQAHGQDGAYYQQVSNVPDTPLCARESCHNLAEKGKRGYKTYCSNACKQKAVRARLQERTRSQFGPSTQGVSETLPTETIEGELFHWRKGRGVVHMGVSPNVTFCGRDTSPMSAVGNDEGHKVCQRCQKTRDESTWWHGDSEAFGM